MTDYIAEAITYAFGKRCPYFAKGCACCESWAQYDRLLSELANARNAALEEARKAVRNTVLMLTQTERSNGDILDDAIYRAIAALKAEGESR